MQYLYILDQKYEKDILNYIGNLFFIGSTAKIRSGSYLKDNAMFRLTLFCKSLQNNTGSKVINYFNILARDIFLFYNASNSQAKESLVFKKLLSSSHLSNIVLKSWREIRASTHSAR